MGTGPGQAGWPAHLPAGALRVVRWSGRYDAAAREQMQARLAAAGARPVAEIGY
jgi:hypothetical protein